MAIYKAITNYEHELVELLDGEGKLLPPIGEYVRKSDYDADLAAAEERGRREGMKYVLENTVRIRKGYEYWNPNTDVYILDGERFGALLEKEAGE